VSFKRTRAHMTKFTQVCEMLLRKQIKEEERRRAHFEAKLNGEYLELLERWKDLQITESLESLRDILWPWSLNKLNPQTRLVTAPLEGPRGGDIFLWGQIYCVLWQGKINEECGEVIRPDITLHLYPHEATVFFGLDYIAQKIILEQKLRDRSVFQDALDLIVLEKLEKREGLFL